MRIPTSVFVMSALTCLPFGLAIRDTMRSHHAAHGDTPYELDGEDTEDADGMRERAEARAEAARAESESDRAEAERTARAEASKRAARKLVVPALIGATPGSLGAAFAGIKLGAPLPVDAEGAAIARASDAGLEMTFTATAKAVDGISVRPDDRGASCDVFLTPLAAAWGEPQQVDLSTIAWIAPSGDRAGIDSERCALVFDRYATVEQFVDRNDAAVLPLGLIGMTRAKLAARLAGRVDLDDDATIIEWTDRGLGLGILPTTLTAKLVGGKVVGVRAHGSTSAAGISALQARLTKLLGAPVPSDGNSYDSSDVQWHGKTPAELDASGTDFHLVVGNMSDSE